MAKRRHFNEVSAISTQARNEIKPSLLILMRYGVLMLAYAFIWLPSALDHTVDKRLASAHECPYHESTMKIRILA